MNLLRPSTALCGLLLSLASSIPEASAQVKAPVAPPTRLENAGLPATRPFHMGFVNWPYDFNPQAEAETYAFIAQNADLITYHHDRGVPWPEALAGTHQYHPNLVAEIDAEVAGLPPGHKLLVTATAQSTARAGELAPYWGADSGMPLPAGWQNRNFADVEVILAHLNWCRYLIDRLQPDYFAYGIEVNGGFMGPSDPALWEYLMLCAYVYPTLRLEYPGLPIMQTVQTGSTQSTRPDFLALSDLLLDYSDYVAVSSYPFLVLQYGGWQTYGDPGLLPHDLLRALRDLEPHKPFAVSETGYIAQDLSMPILGLYQAGSKQWQARYLRGLLWELTRLDAEFVVWFVPRDYDAGLQTMQNLGLPIDESFLIWRDNGLVDELGAPRPALGRWRDWLSLPVR